MNITNYRRAYNIHNGFVNSNPPNNTEPFKAGHFGIVEDINNSLAIEYRDTTWHELNSGAGQNNTVLNQGKCHIAMCRKNNTAYIFKNGILLCKSADDFFNNFSFDINLIRHFPDPPYWINQGWAGIKGQIDDMCLIKGRALWIEDFTPPTSYLPDKISYI